MNNGYDQAKKAIEPLNNIISSIVDEEYNMDFINEMKNIGQEKSIPIEGRLRGEITLLKECRSKVCQQLVEEQEKNKKLKNHHKTSIDLIQQLNRSVMAENHMLVEKSHAVNNLLNDLYEAIDENYTEKLKNDDELAIIHAEAQLNLIMNIIDEIERIQISEMLL